MIEIVKLPDVLRSRQMWLAAALAASLAVPIGLGPDATVTAETSPVTSQFDIVGPVGSQQFGREVLVLSNGNYAVLDPMWDDGTTPGVGAAYLYDGRTDTVISTVRGTTSGDLLSTDLHEVGDSNVLLTSASWDDGATMNVGAITWLDGRGGFDARIGPGNSLVGSQNSDTVGSGSVTSLTNGNATVSSSGWDLGGVPNVGALTWIDGNRPTTGTVGSSNSLVGTQADLPIGANVRALTNGNYVTMSSSWGTGTVANIGAVTWGDGTSGTVGIISAANSLVGGSENDRVGSSRFGNLGVFPLSNGNYVVASGAWDDGSVENVGAVTWGNGDGGTVGPVSASNSMIGSQQDDSVGESGVLALANGNYVIASRLWNRGDSGQPGFVIEAGAATWGDGVSGTAGVVGPANSIVGSHDHDQVGQSSGGVVGVVALTNGNYVVRSKNWDNGSVPNTGAVTWGDGSTATGAVIDGSNSLVGSVEDDQIGGSGVVALTNGNYVVSSARYDTGTFFIDSGAVTWGNGSSGTAGIVGINNSLVGAGSNQFVGQQGVTALTNGNYVIASNQWSTPAIGSRGAVTWGDGSSGSSGIVGLDNSLVGSSAGDAVGEVTALANGNYVVASTSWDNGAVENVGAVTWASGTGPTVGEVGIENSLTGSSFRDRVGSTVRSLSDGHVVVASPDWADDRGAATWIDGTTGLVGMVDESNSLVGSIAGDAVGGGGKSSGSVRTTGGAAGDYIVTSTDWGGDAGAITFGFAGRGVNGRVGTMNSAIGTPPGDVRRPSSTRLTSGDAVPVPTSQNQVLLLRIDRAPTFVSQPPDVEAATVPGAPSALVVFASPMADDVRDGPIASTCVPASGSSFPIGSTTVACTATDSKGLSVSTSFTVTVTATPPTPTTVPPTTVPPATVPSTTLPPVVAGSDVVSLDPARLLETRSGVGLDTIDGVAEGAGRLGAGAERRVPVANRAGVPADAAAVVLNVTAINPDGRGFVTIFPCGDKPLASSLNYAAKGAVVGNEVVAKLSPSGEVCVFSSAETDLTADVVGFIPAGSPVRSLDPGRLLDTRPGEKTIDGLVAGQGRVGKGAELKVKIAGRGGVAVDAAAAILNVTAISPSERGFVTMYPCDERPLASSLNYAGAGAVVGNEVVAKLSESGEVCLFTFAETHLTADVVGYVAAGSTVGSLTPGRVLDTRPGEKTVDGVGAGDGRTGPMIEIEVPIVGRAGVPASNVAAVVMNITAINPTERGFVTMHPCKVVRPLASSLNYDPQGSVGAVVGNEVIAKLSPTGSVCVYTFADTHLTIDVTGYVPT